VIALVGSALVIYGGRYAWLGASALAFTRLHRGRYEIKARKGMTAFVKTGWFYVP
jgi:hypothetical protein